MIKYLLGLALLLSVTKSFAQCGNSSVNHWETIVMDNTQWKYVVPTTAISNWQATAFNDASWLSGNGGMGYGDNDDNTVINTSSRTVYMRKTFTIQDTSTIDQVIFCMDYDDGFVAFLNGVEIARSNMDIGQTWNSFATADHEAQLYQNQQPDYFTLTQSQIASILQNGSNVLAVETHNRTATSPDITSRPFLQLGMTISATTYQAPPAWFTPPSLLESKLPIIVINTLGQTIMDDPRIICDMGIIYNGVGALNCILDSFNNYNGKISIEYRGSTSQGFPKKPFGFSTVDASGTSINVPLIDYPAENDWILLNPYTDKSFMRDVLIYDVARALNWYASRTQFVNLILNGEHQGVYVLLEKIKQDKNRVDVSKLTNTMNAGDSLTGGYIFKVDKVTGSSGNGWASSQGISIQHHDPNWDEVTSAQTNYLTNYINTFENSLWSPSFTNPTTGYRKYANVFSFIDLFILNEISNNLDGYRLSTYIHKDRDSKCGRFTMGPIWDYNLSFGNGDYCNGYQYAGWQLYAGCGNEGSGKWVDKMLQDQWFKNRLNCRWNELRQTTLNTNALLGRIDTYYNYLKETAVIDSARWQTIGNYVWPNGWVAQSWKGEIDSMKLWLSNRLTWMDANMFPSTQACGSLANVNLVIDEINFNSENTIDAGDWLEIYNYGNTSIDLSNAMILDGDKYENYCVIPNNTTLAAGARLVIYSDASLFNAAFPNVTNKYGPLCFKLNNAGQKIVIRDKDYRLITSVNFADSWQCSADGFGRTLQLQSTTSDPNLNASWIAGCIGGSPGVAYNTCGENFITSEINYNSSLTSDAGDWFEMHNKSTSGLNLAGWSIRDQSGSNIYTFPSGYTLGPNSYVVLFSDGAKFTSKFPNTFNKLGPIGFALSNTGDVIRVYNAAGKVVYNVCYGVSNPWPIAANAGGKTMENGLYNGNHNQSATWFAGCPGGSPGIVYDPNCKPLGFKNIQDDEHHLSIYPNPTSSSLRFNTTKPWNEIKILDVLGKVVMQFTTHQEELNVSNLPTGQYILKCNDGKQNYTFTFLKN